MSSQTIPSNISSSLPIASAGQGEQAPASTRRRRLSRRVSRLMAVLATIGTLVGLGMSPASAGYGGTGDCIHTATVTGIAMPMIANNTSLAGYTAQIWLYRWNGSGWAYTGATTWGQADRGFWTNANGNLTNNLVLRAARNSGSYLLWLRYVAPTGATSQGWVSSYEYDNSHTFAGYCQA